MAYMPYYGPPTVIPEQAYVKKSRSRSRRHPSPMMYQEPITVVPPNFPPHYSAAGYEIYPSVPMYPAEPVRMTSSAASNSKKSKKRSQHQDPLQEWSAWRTAINDGLSRDIVNNTYREIPVGENFERLVQPPMKSKHGIYYYSSGIDQATQLQLKDYVNFGIPRANLKHGETLSDSPNTHFSSDSDTEVEQPFYSIRKIRDSELPPRTEDIPSSSYPKRYEWPGDRDAYYREEMKRGKLPTRKSRSHR